MNVIYIAPGKVKGQIDPGVQKKIDNQQRALEALGVHTIVKRFPVEPKNKRILPFATSSIDWKHIQIPNDVQGVYIRYLLSDYQFIKFLRKLRIASPAVKIVVEVPTYPYEKERRSKLVTIRDRLYRRQMQKWVDRIVYIGNKNYDSLFGVDAIQISNGIDLERVHVRQPKSKTDNTIHLMCVANFRPWHGIDRLLNGMIDYYRSGGSVPILLHLVGLGDSIYDLKAMVNNNKELTNRVVFHGYLDGTKLDDIYDLCDIAISSLGAHRKGLSRESSLKSKEYLAKGIPFIGSATLDAFDGIEVDFACPFPADESPIDIEKVVQFYSFIYGKESENQVANRIRTFAEEHVDVRVTMLPVAQFFLGESK